MACLLLYKNPYIFDRLMDLNKDWETAIADYCMGFLANHGGGIDRTKDTQIFKIISDPVPAFKSYEKLENIIEQRVIDILKNQDEINIIWSGGLGSTIILDYFSKYTKNINIFYKKEDLKIIKTIPNYNNFFRYKNYCFSKETLQCDRHYITGEGFIHITDYSKRNWFGDVKISGNAVISDLFVRNIFLMGMFYKKSFERCYAIRKFFENPKRAYEKLYTTSHELIKRSPVKLEKMCDVYWWFTFATKWYTHRSRLKGVFGKNLNYTCFYQTNEFQLWSIENYKTNRRKKFNDLLEYQINKKDSTFTLKRPRDVDSRVRYLTSFIDSDSNFVFDPDEVTVSLVSNIVN